MPRRAWDAPLVGRAAELATLDETMRAAADGAAAVVLIAGDAGIAKSRLTAEAANRARADGWRVLAVVARYRISAAAMVCARSIAMVIGPDLAAIRMGRLSSKGGRVRPGRGGWGDGRSGGA